MNSFFSACIRMLSTPDFALWAIYAFVVQLLYQAEIINFVSVIFCFVAACIGGFLAGLHAKREDREVVR